MKKKIVPCSRSQQVGIMEIQIARADPYKAQMNQTLC